MNYRKIWERVNGPIPKDEHGISYDIHHIDGNRSNNSIENLKCVSVQEHFDIHHKQGDWGACFYLSHRVALSEEEIAFLKQRMTEDNPMKREEVKAKCRRPKPVGFGQKMSEIKKGKSIATKGVKKGPQELVECPHCHKVGGVNGMTRFHFDNCKTITGVTKFDRNKAVPVECPHCGLKGSGGIYRFHFDNCKYKKEELI